MAGSSEVQNTAGVREVLLDLPEDEGEGLGFRLTRTLWDPYPWVREVTPNSRAFAAGLKAGDCIMQADGTDLLGLPVGQVASLIRGDGAGRGVLLTVWNCGVDPSDDPELLWSCGGGSSGERSRRALAGAVKALSCGVCAATATTPLCCARGHLYCLACWSRLEKCALCREPLPPKDSPYARNLVAEQVFEAIATEYEIKNVKKRPTETLSAYTSPNISPSSQRRGQYQLSAINRKKVQFTEKYKQTYASDPNLHRIERENRNLVENVLVENLVEKNGGKCSCQCQKVTRNQNVQTVDVNTDNINCEKMLQHKLVARLRQSCSMADLQNTIQNTQLTKSLNNLGDCKGHHSSLDSLKVQCNSSNDIPVFLLSPPIYLVTCEHRGNDVATCGGGSSGERSRRALAGAVKALSCGVCAATATTPLCCARGHLYCLACWSRLEKCALCREPLPPKDSPYARNLVAEQVFEAIATEYEIKNVKKRPTETLSAYTSPNISPSSQRRGQYQLSAINRKKVQFTEKYKQTYASDPNLHRIERENRNLVENVLVENLVEKNGGKCSCQCQKVTRNQNVQTVDVNTDNINCEKMLQHKLVARLRQSCSMADLQNTIQNTQLTKSLNNLGDCKGHHSSLDSLKVQCNSSNDIPVFLLSPPIYLVTCEHRGNDVAT